jgi:hypothetical protein
MTEHNESTKQKNMKKITDTLSSIQSALLENVDTLSKTHGWDNILYRMVELVNNEIYSSTKPTIEHKTVELKHNRLKVEIDQKIAPLIREIWKSSIDTINSCENNIPENYIWIQFPSAQDFEKFIKIIFENNGTDDSEFMSCLERLTNHQYNPTLENRWIIDINFEDNLFNYETEETNETCEQIDIEISVRFPEKDLDFVYNKFLEYNNIKMIKNLKILREK